MKKEEVQALQPKPEDIALLNTFFCKAVRGNYQFKLITGNMAVTPTVDITGLYNTNLTTLNTYGDGIASLIEKNAGKGTWRKSAKDTIYMLPGTFVPAQEALDAIALIVAEKEYYAALAKYQYHIAALKSKLEDFKTPTEKRLEIEKELREFGEPV